MCAGVPGVSAAHSCSCSAPQAIATGPARRFWGRRAHACSDGTSSCIPQPGGSLCEAERRESNRVGQPAAGTPLRAWMLDLWKPSACCVCFTFRPPEATLIAHVCSCDMVRLHTFMITRFPHNNGPVHQLLLLVRQGCPRRAPAPLPLCAPRPEPDCLVLSQRSPLLLRKSWVFSSTLFSHCVCRGR